MAATHKTTHPPPRAPVEAGGILTLESRRISEPSELTQHSLFLAAEREASGRLLACPMSATGVADGRQG